MTQFELNQQVFKDAGLQVIAIAQGEPKHMQRYCGKLAPSIECLGKDDTSTYKAYGLTRMGLKALTHPGNIGAGIRLAKGGHLPGEVIGDPTMLPGTFIVDQDGIIRYTYYSEYVGDHPGFDDLVQAGSALVNRDHQN